MPDRTTWPLILVLGTVTGAAGAALVLWLSAPAAEARTAPPALAAPSDTSAPRLAELRSSLEGLAARVDGLEDSVAHRAVVPAPADRGAPQEPEPAEPTEPDAAPGAAEPGAELRAMLGAVLGHGPNAASPEEEERFWELARTSDALKQLLAELEAGVEARPDDVAARLELAQAYVAKLLTVPGGPERGIWGARAEEQWREAARIDPRSWEARFALGENYSYYPPFLDKAGEALTWLEDAREVQERRAPEPRFVETYVLLARVHQQRGDTGEARAALEAGLAQHPQSPELLEALAALDG